MVLAILYFPLLGLVLLYPVNHLRCRSLSLCEVGTITSGSIATFCESSFVREVNTIETICQRVDSPQSVYFFCGSSSFSPFLNTA